MSLGENPVCAPSAHQRCEVFLKCGGGTWVGDHDDDAVGAVSDDLRDDVFEDVDVPLHQVQPALSLLLTHTGRHHHDARVRCHRVI